MIYRLMIFLMLCGLAAANVNCLVGGSSSSANNAGWYAPGLFSPSQTHSGNGAPIDFGAGGAATNSGGFVLITETNQFSDTVVGMYINCDFTANTHADGRYVISVVNADDSVVIELAYIGDEGVQGWFVGGAVPIVDATYDLQDVLDDSIGSAASQDVDILITGTGNLTATIDWDTGGGTATTTKSLIGVNPSYVDDGTKATLTTTTTLANGLVQITTIDWLKFKNIDFDGGGKDATRAVYGILVSSTISGQDTVFENCHFFGASADGARVRTTKVDFINCEFSLNGGHGFFTISSTSQQRLDSCSFHDNDASGMTARWTLGGIVSNSLFFDNGTHGFVIVSVGSVNVHINGCTFYSNTTNGIEIPAGSAIGLVMFNNTAVSNGGYGYDFNGSGINVAKFFAYNHASVNTTAHTDAVADASFAALGDGNNINGSQAASAIFVDAANEDFTPKAGSDLIDAGLDVQSTPTIDIGAIQLDAVGNGNGGFPATSMLGGLIQE